MDERFSEQYCKQEDSLAWGKLSGDPEISPKTLYISSAAAVSWDRLHFPICSFHTRSKRKLGMGVPNALTVKIQSTKFPPTIKYTTMMVYWFYEKRAKGYRIK